MNCRPEEEEAVWEWELKECGTKEWEYEAWGLEEWESENWKLAVWELEEWVNEEWEFEERSGEMVLGFGMMWTFCNSSVDVTCL